MQALLQALHEALGQETAWRLVDHLGMKRFLNYCRRQLPSDKQWRAIGIFLAGEVTEPAQPWPLPRHEALDRLNTAARLLGEAASAIEALSPALLYAMENPAATMRGWQALVECCARAATDCPSIGTVSRHHQGDMAQRGMSERLHKVIAYHWGQPEYGHASAIAGAVEAITGRPCSRKKVQRWLNGT